MNILSSARYVCECSVPRRGEDEIVPPVSSAANKADTRIHMQRRATADGVGSDHDQRLKDTDAFIAGVGGVTCWDQSFDKRV